MGATVCEPHVRDVIRHRERVPQLTWQRSPVDGSVHLTVFPHDAEVWAETSLSLLMLAVLCVRLSARSLYKRCGRVFAAQLACFVSECVWENASIVHQPADSASEVVSPSVSALVTRCCLLSPQQRHVRQHVTWPSMTRRDVR